MNLSGEDVEGRVQFLNESTPPPAAYHNPQLSNGGRVTGHGMGEGGFTCRGCGKVEYTQGEFSTIKLGDIFSDFASNKSSRDTELCSGCLKGVDPWVKGQHVMSNGGVINNNGMPIMKTSPASSNSVIMHHNHNHTPLSFTNSVLTSGPNLLAAAAAAASIDFGGDSPVSSPRPLGGLDRSLQNGQVLMQIFRDNSNDTLSMQQHHTHNSALTYSQHLGGGDSSEAYFTGSPSSVGGVVGKGSIPHLTRRNMDYVHLSVDNSCGSNGPFESLLSSNNNSGLVKSLAAASDQSLSQVKPSSDSSSSVLVKASPPKRRTKKVKVEPEGEPARVPCTLCKKTFKNNKMASIHLKRVHEKVNRFVCEICGVVFSYRGSLDSHLVSHNPPEITHDCTVCGQKFKEKCNLNKHVRYHTDNPKKFLCEHCPSGFSKRVNLRYHIKRKHPEVGMNNNSFSANNNQSVPPPYSSSSTISSPSSNGGGKSVDLLVPAIINSVTASGSMTPSPGVPRGDGGGRGSKVKDNKPQGNFSCEQCGRTFLFKNNLKAHLRTHTRDKKYTCELCQKSFIYKESLKNHMLLHSNELPYLCDICGKKFRDRSNRRKHVKNVHKYMFVNGDITKPISKVDGEGGAGSLTQSGPSGPPSLEAPPPPKKRKGKKSSGDAATTNAPAKPRNARAKKSKPAAQSSSSSNKSVIVNAASITDVSSVLDRKIIMSPSPKHQGSPGEYHVHGGGVVQQQGHLPLAGHFSHSSLGGRNIIVKAASSTIPSNHNQPDINFSSGPPMQQNVIVYPKNKGQGDPDHHQYSPGGSGSVISLNLQHQQEQYYSTAVGEEGLRVYDYQSQNSGGGYEYLNSLHHSTNSSSSTEQEDVKLFGATAPGEYYSSAEGGQLLYHPQQHGLPPQHSHGHRPGPLPHHTQQHLQHYWTPTLDQPHSPYSLAVVEGPQANAYESSGSNHPITSASNVLNVPAYGQPHASEPLDPGAATAGHHYYKDFDFSYL